MATHKRSAELKLELSQIGSLKGRDRLASLKRILAGIREIELQASVNPDYSLIEIREAQRMVRPIQTKIDATYKALKKKEQYHGLD